MISPPGGQVTKRVNYSKYPVIRLRIDLTDGCSLWSSPSGILNFQHVSQAHFILRKGWHNCERQPSSIRTNVSFPSAEERRFHSCCLTVLFYHHVSNCLRQRLLHITHYTAEIVWVVWKYTPFQSSFQLSLWLNEISCFYSQINVSCTFSLIKYFSVNLCFPWSVWASARTAFMPGQWSCKRGVDRW